MTTSSNVYFLRDAHEQAGIIVVAVARADELVRIELWRECVWLVCGCC